MTGNNLTGTFDESIILLSFQLESLKLANNNISGTFGGNSFFSLRKLKHIDLSRNNFNKSVNILAFPAANHLNFSHNNFDSIKFFRKFRPASKGLRVVDLSNNQIKQDISQIFSAIPPSLVELSLADNNIIGNLPETLPTLGSMWRMSLENNNMNGTLPDFPRYIPRLRELDLSNQAKNGGLTGSIPAGLSNLGDLKLLDFSGNALKDNIPSDIGNFAQLKRLNLSNNRLSGIIPSELGKLVGTQ